MRGSRLVAGLFGPVLIALALSDATKLHIWTNTPAPVAYLSSTLLFVGGVGGLSIANAQLEEIDVLLASGIFLTFAAYGSRQGGE